ncbi:MAG: effector-associated constant component EACC1 [Nocardioides sp.]
MTEDIRVEFVSAPDADPEEIDALTRALRAEILEVDEVDRVEQATAGPAPDGSKGLDVAAIGALVVGVAPGIQAVAKVIEVVRGWLANRSPSTPPLQMSIGDKTITVVADKKQQDELVAAFVAALRTTDASEATAAVKPAE